jgi:prepilin-type N-terminal cleavage/methylation domain-containing protein
MMRKRGFTLVELLVVLVILATLATAAVSVIEQVDDQARYDDTKARLAQLEAGVVGRADRTLNGEPELSGFVADMGRLPDSVQELLEPAALTSYSADLGSGVPGGWRGPYVKPQLESGAIAFRDGFRTAGAAPSYGWGFAKTSATLTLTSFGADGVAGGTGYDVDLATTLAADAWQVDLSGFSLVVRLVNRGAADVIVPASRVRVVRPTNGANAPLGGALSLVSPVTTVPAGTTLDVVFAFGSAPENKLPIGPGALVVVADSDGSAIPGGLPRRFSLVPRAALPSNLVLVWTVG